MVGCLDVNQGATLPAEQLVGRLPAEGDRRHARAYISNVAVWEGARRRGIARLLLREAMREAAAAGVQHLYGACGGVAAGVDGPLGCLRCLLASKGRLHPLLPRAWADLAS